MCNFLYEAKFCIQKQYELLENIAGMKAGSPDEVDFLFYLILQDALWLRGRLGL
jgi:hypothetical protein